MNHRYTKLPITIEAFQITEETRRDNRDWPEWLNKAWQDDHQTMGSVFPAMYPNSDGTDALMVNTLEGFMVVSWGDWIIRGVEGELYPCRPSIFEATYRPEGDV